MLCTASQALSATQAVLLPTHDPMVGRVVGQMMQRMDFEGKAPRVLIHGKLNQTEDVNIAYQRHEDGTVTADGWVGSVEIHQTLSPEAYESSEGSMFFGVVGRSSKDTAANVEGHTAGAEDKLAVGSYRTTTNATLTEELKAQGQSTFKWGMGVRVSPSFGGEYVETNLIPGHAPAETEPIKASDTYGVWGSTGGVQVSRMLEWDTTTWAVSYNDREAMGWNELYQAESGSASFTLKCGDEEVRTVAPLSISVSNGIALCEGNIETRTVADNGVEQTAVSMRYERIPGKVAVKVTEDIGHDHIEFSIFPDPNAP